MMDIECYYLFFILKSIDDYLITWGSRGLMDRESDL